VGVGSSHGIDLPPVEGLVLRRNGPHCSRFVYSDTIGCISCCECSRKLPTTARTWKSPCSFRTASADALLLCVIGISLLVPAGCDCGVYYCHCCCWNQQIQIINNIIVHTVGALMINSM